MPFRDFFPPEVPPWEWVRQIGPALASGEFQPGWGDRVLPAGVHLSGPVYLHPTVRLPPYCVIQGPAWIGPNCEIRPSAYLRGQVIAGPGCVLGNSCEYKNCLLLEKVETAHFNYVGDSVLGNRAHLGAGVVCANLKLLRDEVVVALPDGRQRTGLRKLGALVGDGAEVACNSVLQPGTILGRGSIVLTMAFGGYLAPETLARPKVETQRLPRPR